MKFVCVTGGVISGLGKGIVASSTGLLLQQSGLKVTSIKIDPYLNVDAGTMSPFEHGECFVCNDGAETDLDIGNYERFLNLSLTAAHNLTTGKIYHRVLNNERQGKYLGRTVQTVPHVTDAIIDHIRTVSRVPVDGSEDVPDVCLIELGGTVGDIESQVYLEALRQLANRVGRDNLCLLHVVKVITTGEGQKSKPTQHSMKELRSAGLQPDAIICRCQGELSRSVREKISLFGNVPAGSVFANIDLPSIYAVPEYLNRQGLAQAVLARLRMNVLPPSGMPQWLQNAAQNHATQLPELHIALVGKYTGNPDSYLSVAKALEAACVRAQRRLVIEYIEGSSLMKGEENYEQEWQRLKRCHGTILRCRRTSGVYTSGVSLGILVPGGFGDRSTEGKIAAIAYARESGVPFFGICLGMQLAVVEFARNVVGITKATSQEFVKEASSPSMSLEEQEDNCVIVFMPEHGKVMGGGMRLGAHTTIIQDKQSLAYKLYGKTHVSERHRHRYEVSPAHIAQLQEGGLIFSGVGEGAEQDKPRMEILELPQDQHPFFFAVQFHPEFISRPMKPQPVFCGFVNASCDQQ
ncbi:MAG: hypothetical protein MHM6MM_001013 [Cercozoa sp. M6MM]